MRLRARASRIPFRDWPVNPLVRSLPVAVLEGSSKRRSRALSRQISTYSHKTIDLQIVGDANSGTMVSEVACHRAADAADAAEHSDNFALLPLASPAESLLAARGSTLSSGIQTFFRGWLPAYGRRVFRRRAFFLANAPVPAYPTDDPRIERGSWAVH